MKSKKNSTNRRLAWIILITGIVCFVMAWLVEINFHDWQGFQNDEAKNMSQFEKFQNFMNNTDTFWAAERGIVLASMTFLIMGIVLIFLGILYVIRSKGKK